MGMLSEVRQHPIRGIKTLCLVLLFFYCGLGIAIVGPTLINIQDRTNATLTEASYGLSFRSAGAGVGSLLGIS